MRLTLKIAMRFWGNVPDRPARGCWEWRGGKTSDGYGSFRVDSSRTTTAHRVAYGLSRGSLPEGLICCHACDNPACVRPTHLWMGTHQENVTDARQKGRMGSAALDDGVVLEIRKRLAQGESQMALSREYGVNQSTIHGIAHGHTWRRLL